MRVLFIGAAMLGAAAAPGVVAPPHAETTGASAAGTRSSEASGGLLVSVASPTRPGTMVTIAATGGTVELLGDSAHVPLLRAKAPVSVLVDSTVRDLHVSTSDATALRVSFYRDGAMVPPASGGDDTPPGSVFPPRDPNALAGPSRATERNYVWGRDLHLARAGRSFRVVVEMYPIAP